MPYTPTVWVNGIAPALSAANLNKLETQYDEAVGDINRKLQPPIVRWTSPGWYWTDPFSSVVTANRIYYMPIYVEETTTYIRIGIEVNAGDGAGGVADLRIFEWDNGVPGDLILSAGTVSTNGAGLKEIVIAEALTPGYYFLAVRCDQTPTLVGPSPSLSTTVPVSGLSLTGNMINKGVILYDDAAYSDPAGTVDGSAFQQFGFLTLREN